MIRAILAQSYPLIVPRPNVTSIGTVFNAAPITSSIQCIERNIKTSLTAFRKAPGAAANVKLTFQSDRSAGADRSSRSPCAILLILLWLAHGTG
jgi:hypothetical protein